MALIKKSNITNLTKSNLSIIKPEDFEDLKKIIQQRIKEKGPKCDLNDIDVSDIKSFNGLFAIFLDFNGDISQWDVSSAEDMDSMFANSSFNGDISEWDVSKVINMESMFQNSDFNGDISNWDVRNVNDMAYMFYKSKFNGDISKWNPCKVQISANMFKQSPLENNEPKWYKGWYVEWKA